MAGDDRRSSDKVSQQDPVLRKLWIHRSLELQRAALVRSRAKEIAGGEIYLLRSKEIQFVDTLLEEFA